MTSERYRSQSLWLDTVPDPLESRPALAGARDVDVAIIGAGFTGLWTAFYLKTLDPGLRVAVVEAEIAGFGASGRNGGWCMGTLAGIGNLFDDDPEGAVRLQRELFDTVDEVQRVCLAEGIDCHWAKGGNITVATSGVFRQELEHDLEFWRGIGAGQSDAHWLEPEGCEQFVRPSLNFGGIYLAHVAALHPGRLVRGLAETVEKHGVRVYELSPATAIEGTTVRTTHGSLTASTVVRATEGYTSSIRDQRGLIPVHSMMIATEPLAEHVWDDIGFTDRITFGDPRRDVTYAQRTADGRVAFGCRGSYFYGSKIHNRFAPDDPAFEEVQSVMESLFPPLRGQEISHRWGGALGIPRTWTPSVGLDRGSGLAWAGGFVGEGVGAANLAGRTLAEMILEVDSPRTTLPWIDRPLPNWEPEPLRYLGYAALARLATALDSANLNESPTPRLRGAIYNHFVRK